jgi:hypothetical protein
VGLVVEVRGQTLAPGCDHAASAPDRYPQRAPDAVTVASRVDGADDLPRLRACLERVLATNEAIADGDRVTVAAARSVTLERVVAIADAVRVERAGRVFFGDVALGGSK